MIIYLYFHNRVIQSFGTCFRDLKILPTLYIVILQWIILRF